MSPAAQALVEPAGAALALIDPSDLAALADLADDGETLARLHDRELDAATIAGLREISFPDNLALLPQSTAASDAWAAMRTALAEIPEPPATADLDALAVEFAAIYLTGAYGAAPSESFWLDPDHIVCQQPMFDLREVYKAAGLAAENWRTRPDDHLVLQLQYIAHMLRRIASPEKGIPCGHADFSRELAQTMDAHLLRWLPDFAARVAARTALPFHAGLAYLTLAWCQSLRSLLGPPPPAKRRK
jgi:TorA maturation chaperone TorD